MDPVFMLFVQEAEEDERRELLRLNRKNLRDHSNVFEMPEHEFRKCFRLSKDLVLNLFDELTPHMNMGQRNGRVSIHIRILAALRFFSQGSYQRAVGNESYVGLAQQTFSTALSEVCSAFVQIAPRWIQFPVTGEDKETKKRDFMQEFQFPGVVGCVDGTHVAILQPVENEHLYFNRKGFHSKNVQVICDSNLLILSINARYGGATHDSFIWRNSEIRQHLEENYRRGDRNSWLLGDSGYAQEPWLMTPIRNAPRDSPEGRYTASLTRARNCVERTIGLLKMRFRCILKERVLRYDPNKVGQIVIAVSVLHNMCMRGNIPFDDIDIENEEDPHGVIGLHCDRQELHCDISPMIASDIFRDHHSRRLEDSTE